MKKIVWIVSFCFLFTSCASYSAVRLPNKMPDDLHSLQKIENVNVGLHLLDEDEI
ncbi:MAG: hypothetical protein ACYS0I_08305 [Planctomycetota bacterium]|jgi:hypothetical protein